MDKYSAPQKPLKHTSSMAWIAFPLFSSALLAGCVGNHLNKNPQQTVTISYIHVGNVEAAADETRRVSGRKDDQGFWAVFDLCAIDFDGPNLRGFSYEARNFYVSIGDQRHVAGPRERVNAASTFNRQDTEVHAYDATSQALRLDPTEHYFPKQHYSKLAYRLAIYLDASHKPYANGRMLLRSTLPEVVLLDQSASDRAPWLSDIALTEGSFTNRCPH